MSDDRPRPAARRTSTTGSRSTTIRCPAGGRGSSGRPSCSRSATGSTTRSARGPSIVAQYEAEMRAAAERGRPPARRGPAGSTRGVAARARRRTPASWRRRKEIFATRCAPCHGARGPGHHRARTSPTTTGCTAGTLDRDPARPSARACPRRAWCPGRTSSSPPRSARMAAYVRHAARAPTRRTPSRRKASTEGRARRPAAPAAATRHRVTRRCLASARRPRAQERVLPTLNVDGTRRWIRPQLFAGRFCRRRRALAWVADRRSSPRCPYLTMGGKPAHPARRRRAGEFTLFGATFLPTDTHAADAPARRALRRRLPAHRDLRPRLVRLGLPADGVHGVPVPAHRAAHRGRPARASSELDGRRFAPAPRSLKYARLRRAQHVPRPHLPRVLRGRRARSPTG